MSSALYPTATILSIAGTKSMTEERITQGDFTIACFVTSLNRSHYCLPLHISLLSVIKHKKMGTGRVDPRSP